MGRSRASPVACISCPMRRWERTRDFFVAEREGFEPSKGF
jgi:hypothetical protein